MTFKIDPTEFQASKPFCKIDHCNKITTWHRQVATARQENAALATTA
jgi:hypothetical protein